MSHELKKKFINGAEVPDTTRRSIPVKKSMPTRFEEFQAMLKTASYLAKESGFDSVEDFDDFSTDEEDTVPEARWELEFDNVLGKDITKGEMAFLEQQRAAFTRKFGKEVPWWQKTFQKYAARDQSRAEPSADSKKAPSEKKE